MKKRRLLENKGVFLVNLDNRVKSILNPITMLNINMYHGKLADAQLIVANLLQKQKMGYFCFINIFSLISAHSSGAIFRALSHSELNFIDGMGTLWGANILGYKIKERIRGVDFMRALCQYAGQNKKRIVLYGNTPDNLEKLEKILLKQYQNLQVVGTYSPPFRDLSETENDAIIDSINASLPDIIFVALGSPKQELWMYKNHKRIHGLLFGVGAAFDFVTGELKESPIWMQRIGLEWLFRFPQQPKKTSMRMLVAPLFFFLVLKEKILRIKKNRKNI